MIQRLQMVQDKYGKAQDIKYMKGIAYVYIYVMKLLFMAKTSQ